MLAINIAYALAVAAPIQAHVAAFVKGMYCEGGKDPNKYEQNANDAVNPLYNLTRDQWWMQNANGCKTVPPRDGSSLAIPAGGNFLVELSHNQGQTTLSFDGQYTSDWPDGQNHTEPWVGPPTGEGCLSDGLMHTQNESMAAGTAFAISYQSDISKVTMENLVVFTVAAK